MASTTLLLLAACRVPALKTRISVEVATVGEHLIPLIQVWMAIHGNDVSPSVMQSVEMIRKVDVLIKRELNYDR